MSLFLCYDTDMEKNLSVIEYISYDFYFLYLKKLSDEGITSNAWHEHSFYEIMYFDKGASEFVIENRRYEVKEGDVLLIKPGKHHFQRKIFDSENSLFCIGFHQDAIESHEMAKELFERGSHFSLGSDSGLSHLLLAAKEKLSKNKNESEIFVKAVCEAAISILLDTDMKREKSKQIKNDSVNKVIKFINENLTEIQSTEDITKALFFSESYLRAIFKREMGISVMQYVRNKKLLLADRMLRNGKKPTETYSECGFLNYSSFFRAYLSHFKVSPKARKL